MDPRGRGGDRCAVVRAAAEGDPLTPAAPAGRVHEESDGAAILRLVRHGETEWNALGLIQGHTDNPLNERGRSQAAAAGRELAGREYAAVVTSPLARASETARIIASALNVATFHVEADLAGRSATSPSIPTGRTVGRRSSPRRSSARTPCLLRCLSRQTECRGRQRRRFGNGGSTPSTRNDG
ncbi:histidine phosphatase family protein [Microbacterium sp. TNHR37B]|uniref:histidine phosphatase family protein n=1 Tax=Microbacterium sp. TNHR37B TaxID=1775956 RepID=UPI0008317E80|nr:histidine phosphatase family protein [Microbacterium sp. TNHR37B]